MEKILTVSDHDVQTNLWQEGPGSKDAMYFKDTLRSSFYWLFELSDSPRYFVSALPNGTTTGVLRQHAARMDTRVNCTLVESFPSPCPGQRPFQAAFSHDIASVRICAEGAFDQSPWTRSRDRQTVSEQLWIQVNGRSVELQRDSNYTMRCDANSTRGWFELGNLRNNYTHGPLLESWPPAEEIRTEFNDKSPVMSSNDYPSREQVPHSFLPPQLRFLACSLTNVLSIIESLNRDICTFQTGSIHRILFTLMHCQLPGHSRRRR